MTGRSRKLNISRAQGPALTKNDHSSLAAIADHVSAIGHDDIKWDHFEIFVS